MSWLPSLITANAEEGFDLAIKLSHMGVKKTQPNDEIRAKLRPVYENDADSVACYRDEFPNSCSCQ